MSRSHPTYVSPSVKQTAFNCPHCGALAQQFWHDLRVVRRPENKLPPSAEIASQDSLRTIQDEARREALMRWFAAMEAGRVLVEQSQDAPYSRYLGNLYISQCFRCDDVAVWLKDRLLWPIVGDAPPPNLDLPEEMRADYDEASSILNLSPRGSAALLRLVIEKLCKHLGGAGDDLNKDIGLLVSRGMPAQVQQALDVVRVIGNRAVHPGQIDIRDDRATAQALFGLVNLICEQMITQPRHVAELFGNLPEGARNAIARRDQPKP